MSRVTQPISIPEPTNDPDALWKTAVALKEAVEVLQGIRGNRPAVVESDYEAVVTNFESRVSFVENLPYAEIYVEGNATTTSVSNSGYTQVTVFDTNGEYKGIAPDHTNDHITLDSSGTFFVASSLSVLNSSGAAHIIDVEVEKNNGATTFTNLHASRNLPTGTDVGSMTISGIISGILGDTIELWATSDSGTSRNVTFEDVTLSVVQIGK